jgi:YidC/Oxa1 family membrane protein insertase
MTPSKEEKEAMKHHQDSIARVQHVQDSIKLARLTEQHRQDSIRKAGEPAPAIEPDTTTIVNIDRDKLGVFANSSVGNEELFILESEKLKLSISSKGGKIVSVQLKEFQTYDSLPLNLFDPDKTYFGLSFFANSRLINTNGLFFQPVWINQSTDGSGSLSMRLYADSDTSFNKDSYIEFLYSLKDNDYMMDFDINFVGMNQIIDQGTNLIDLTWKTDLLQLEKSVDRFNGPTIYYKFYQDDVLGHDPASSCPAGYDRESRIFNGGVDTAYFCVYNEPSAPVIPQIATLSIPGQSS